MKGSSGSYYEAEVCQLWGFQMHHVFINFVLYQLRCVCVCGCVTKLSRVSFCTNEFPPIFCCYRKPHQMVKEAMIFQPPKKTR